ncbi:prolipoprotein diacylglyceryl transferase [Mycoplasmopsis ciconiae]|uniref:Phosphatidylglycerol--prolipoprotein diacylglyceryl transferase n=1 Tax=Mycoplasmopsis ciconiae TaxID=561067 RepID=A0ABU7MLX2_9BACT|nr:prolipoprotein diacylglyceryl transferase [Mycoplasmopsis ciconiae]
MINNLAAAWVPSAAIRANTPSYIFQTSFFDLRVYSLMLMLGILCSVLTILFFWIRAKYKIETLLTFVLITIPLSLLGSRLGYIIEALIYENEPFKGSAWYRIWDGGLSIQGGIILAVIGDLIYGYTKRSEIDMRLVANYIIPTILIGQFVGRFGNYANHEVYGKIDWSGNSVLIFGKSFATNMYISDSLSDSLGLEGAYRYPLFLYEALFSLFGYIILVWVINLFGLSKPGTTASLYFVYYGVVRIVMEPMRQEAFGYYSVLSFMFILFGLLAFIYFQFLSLVEYIKVKKGYYYDYVIMHQSAYIDYVNATSFKAFYYKLISHLTKNKKTKTA